MKTLIAYGTRYGSAKIVAQEIADFLGSKGHETTVVDLRKEKVPRNLKDFDSIVVGGSVAMFMWLAKVKGFLRKCHRSQVTTAVYITCGTAIEDRQKAREKFLDTVIEKIGIKTAVAEPIEPIIDFRPNLGLPQALKARISGTIAAMTKDRFQADGLMDLRDRAFFQQYLRNLENALS